MNLDDKDKIISKQQDIINQLIKDRDKWFLEYRKALMEHQSIMNSKFWTISEPIRKTLDNIKETKRNIQNSKKEKAIDLTDSNYNVWISNNETNNDVCEKLDYNPLISIVVYNCEFLDKCLDSIEKQTYNNYQVIIVSDNDVAGISNDKVSFVIKEKNKDNIPINIKNGIDACKGKFVLMLNSKNILSVNALYEIAKALNENEDLKLIYFDEDNISYDGSIRFKPFFKPDYSLNTLLSFNYIGDSFLFKKELVSNSDIDSLYDLVLKVCEKSNREDICHISKVLHHNRVSNNYDNTDINQNTKDTIEKSLQRRNIKALVDVDEYNCNHIIYENNNEKISIIIPSKDNESILKMCIESIESKSTYNNYEIVVVDNGSNEENKNNIKNYLDSKKIKYIYEKHPFNFSYMCNLGADNSTGDYYLFLNDDIEITQDNWLEVLLGQARQSDTGAVGVKLLYPNTNLIQHCGVVNYSFGPSHYLNKCEDDKAYYFYRNKADYNVLASTAACLMISKEKFDLVGRFNEKLPNNYNDVDLCIRLYERGFYNIIRNDVVLNHHESLSRGETMSSIEKTKLVIKDRNMMYSFNEKYLMYDPFYNKNLSQIDNVFGIDVF